MEEADGSDDSENTTARFCCRRYAAGLANLGNTCYMNTTLECLAYTEPLKRYFLSGDFQNDLNRDNPLGTGGELATQFAHLLAKMWVSEQSMPSGAADAEPQQFATGMATTIVAPHEFKEVLGKHAKQFTGTDQHDMQELATYLLDKLHEDCNRVKVKPAIETYEKAEDETDKVASDKAWALDLKRDDSIVQDSFNVQVKSRVQCCKHGCGGDSTTFGNLTSLSVPIPGSEVRLLSTAYEAPSTAGTGEGEGESILTVTFVPLDSVRRPVEFEVKMPKKIRMFELSAYVRRQLIFRPAVNDLVACAICDNKISEWYDRENDTEVGQMEDACDRRLFVYELIAAKSLSESAVADAVTVEVRLEVGVTPLALRIQKATTFHELQNLVAKRISPCCKVAEKAFKMMAQAELSYHPAPTIINDGDGGVFDDKVTVTVNWDRIDTANKSFEAIKWETRDKPIQASVSILDCIKKFCEREQLGETERWKCTKCKEHVCAWKTLQISRSPEYLFIHLKRFNYAAESQRGDKNHDFVRCPLKGLNLTDQVLHSEKGKEPIYDCYAVSNHIGGFRRGHYTTYVLNGDGDWCLYSDTKMTPHIPPDQVISDKAYFLCYRRRDLQVGQAFDIKLPISVPSKNLSGDVSEGAPLSTGKILLDCLDGLQAAFFLQKAKGSRAKLWEVAMVRSGSADTCYFSLECSSLQHPNT